MCGASVLSVTRVVVGGLSSLTAVVLREIEVHLSIFYGYLILAINECVASCVT